VSVCVCLSLCRFFTLGCRPRVLNLVLATTTVLIWYCMVLFDIYINCLIFGISSRHFVPVLAVGKYYCSAWRCKKVENPWRQYPGLLQRPKRTNGFALRGFLQLLGAPTPGIAPVRLFPLGLWPLRFASYWGTDNRSCSPPPQFSLPNLAFARF
jgi:hypothetical protein